jgi:hypothetical protein
MKKSWIIFICLFISVLSKAQELFVHADPASNMPAKSIAFALTNKHMPQTIHSRTPENRTQFQLHFGLSKNLMLTGGVTFSDMYTSAFEWESASLYAKYRFFSNDDVHAHFRMAGFAKLAYSKNDLYYDEIDFDGDQSGLQLGLIATKLINRFAISGTVSYNRVLSSLPKFYIADPFYYNAVNYSLSTGLLILPVEYKDYKQTNVNLYMELLGMQNIDGGFTGIKRYAIDLAPSVQFIFNSQFKVDISHRYQIASNGMHRMWTNSWFLRLEYDWLNALKKKK